MHCTACTDPQGTRRMPIESTARAGARVQSKGSGEHACSSGGSSSDSASEDSKAALATASASSSASRAVDSKLSTSLWYKNLVRLVGGSEASIGSEGCPVEPERLVPWLGGGELRLHPQGFYGVVPAVQQCGREAMVSLKPSAVFRKA